MSRLKRRPYHRALNVLLRVSLMVILSSAMVTAQASSFWLGVGQSYFYRQSTNLVWQLIESPQLSFFYQEGNWRWGFDYAWISPLREGNETLSFEQKADIVQLSGEYLWHLSGPFFISGKLGLGFAQAIYQQKVYSSIHRESTGWKEQIHMAVALNYALWRNMFVQGALFQEYNVFHGAQGQMGALVNLSFQMY